MTKYLIQPTIYLFLTALIILTSCSGQVKPVIQKENENLSIDQTKIPKPINNISEVRIGCSIQDSDGNLWFGSIGEGLYKFDGKIFFHYGMEQGLNSNAIYSILQDKSGNIWVGTDKGINFLEGNNFKNIPIELNNNISSYLFNNTNRITLTENTVWSMMQDRNGTIWIGTDDAVYCYDTQMNEKTGQQKMFSRFLDNQFLMNKDSLQLKGIFSILETKNGNIWFAECESEGITSFDGKSLSTIIPYNEIRRTDRIIEDKQNNLWFATAFKGIGKYDGKTYTPNIFKAPDLNGSYNILEDSHGNIWFDTQDGLGFYDGKNHTILTEKEGTNVKDFIPILLDKAGNLWFSSKGMKLYKYDGKTFTNYSE
jgi:ligand-binding sensor domain-containing protein